MADLPINFIDDVLSDTMGGKRRFRMIQNDDGTVSFEDATDYSQIGSDFGAAQVNQTNEAVNEKLESADVVDPMVATEEGFAADAKKTGDALSELNKKITIKSKSFNGTTSEKGNVSCSDLSEDIVILQTLCTSSNGIIIVPYACIGGVWWFHCSTEVDTTHYNKQVSAIIYYIDK